jgi:hypothetical protein
VTDPIGWIDGRRPAPPPSLRREIETAMAQDDPGAGPLAERLAAVGMAALGRVASRPQGREEALRLLAADALITYACEAAAEAEADGDAGAIDRITAALDPASFARLHQEDAT